MQKIKYSFILLIASISIFLLNKHFSQNEFIVEGKSSKQDIATEKPTEKTLVSEESSSEASPENLTILDSNQRPLKIVSNASATKKNNIELIHEFVNSHSNEFKELFNLLIDARSQYSLKKSTDSYANFLKQSGDNEWAKEAYLALSEHFNALQNDRYSVVRLDCRRTRCEIVGSINELRYNRFDPKATNKEFIKYCRIMLGAEFKKEGIYGHLFEKRFGTSMSVGSPMYIYTPESEELTSAPFAVFTYKSRNYLKDP